MRYRSRIPLGARIWRHAFAAAFFALAIAASPSLSRAHEQPSAQIADLSRRIAAEPDVATNFLRRGELELLLGRFDEARADFDRAERLDSGLAEVDLWRAHLALAQQEPRRAIELADRFLSRAPRNHEGFRVRARARMASGDARGAARDYDEAIAVAWQPSPDDYLERASALAALGAGALDEALRGLDEGERRLGAPVALSLRAIELEMARGDTAAARIRRERVESALHESVPSGNGAPPAATRAFPANPAHVPATPSRGAVTIHVPAGATWKYDATGADRGTTWRAPAYNDQAWPQGAAPLGYGEPYIATTIPNGSPTNVYPTSYFRVAFNVTGAAKIERLTVRANLDDGFVAYLNGQEILRRNMPTGPIVYTTYAAGGHEAGAFETFDVSAFVGALVEGSNVLAVEAHQVNATSSDLVIDVELSSSTDDAVVTRGPYLQLGTPTSVVVRWRTDTPVVGRVRYGAAASNLQLFVDEPAATTEHSVTIANLPPDSQIYYSIGTPSAVYVGGDPDHFVVTAPAQGTSKPTRIWVIGDSGEPGIDAINVRDAYLQYTGARGTDLWLMLGDNAYDAGTDAEYQGAVFDMYGDILRSSVLWPTRGNHDVLYSGANNDYYDIFTMPMAGQAGGVASGSEAYYSFDYGNIHFVCLDSEGSSRTPGSAMLSWLETDLAATAKDWVIAYWHHPPYTKGSHDSDNPGDSGGRMEDMRENALPILEAGGVDLVLTGHSHSYERSYLIDGHYGTSDTFDKSMLVDGGDGNEGGDGAYVKPTLGAASHEGSVYAVAGSSSKISGGDLNHPVMVVSSNTLGSLVLDVDGNRLDVRFLTDSKLVLDEFTILKGEPVGVSSAGAPEAPLAIASVRPTPSRGYARIAYSLPRAGHVEVAIHDAAGRQIAMLASAWREAGAHEAVWNGGAGSGDRAAAGVYFARVAFEGRQVTQKIVVLR